MNAFHPFPSAYIPDCPSHYEELQLLQGIRLLGRFVVDFAHSDETAAKFATTNSFMLHNILISSASLTHLAFSANLKQHFRPFGNGRFKDQSSLSMDALSAMLGHLLKRYDAETLPADVVTWFYANFDYLCKTFCTSTSPRPISHVMQTDDTDPNGRFDDMAAPAPTPSPLDTSFRGFPERVAPMEMQIFTSEVASPIPFHAAVDFAATSSPPSDGTVYAYSSVAAWDAGSNISGSARFTSDSLLETGSPVPRHTHNEANKPETDERIMDTTSWHVLQWNDLIREDAFGETDPDDDDDDDDENLADHENEEDYYGVISNFIPHQFDLGRFNVTPFVAFLADSIDSTVDFLGLDPQSYKAG